MCCRNPYIPSGVSLLDGRLVINPPSSLQMNPTLILIPGILTLLLNLIWKPNKALEQTIVMVSREEW